MANSTTYKVLVVGIGEGHRWEDVKEKLSALLRVAPERIDLLLQEKPMVVKKDLDRASALKLKSILESTGVLCGIEITKRSDKSPLKGQVDLAAISVDDSEKTMVCPKCGFRQRPSDTCVRCAIMVDKFLSMIEHEEPVGENGFEASPVVTSTSGAYEQLIKFLGTKYGLVSAGVVVILLVGLLFEFLYLQGDLIASGSVDIVNKKDAFEITVTQPWKEYLVEISTAGRQRKLIYRLVGPEGMVLHEDIEYESRKGARTFTFKPSMSGTYTLYVDPGVLTYGGWGYAYVKVYINDRRLFHRILDWFNL